MKKKELRCNFKYIIKEIPPGDIAFDFLNKKVYNKINNEIMEKVEQITSIVHEFVNEGLMDISYEE